MNSELIADRYREQINALADAYFRDLERDGRQDTEEDLRAWLWFTCPAHLRVEVEAQIEEKRTKQHAPVRWWKCKACNMSFKLPWEATDTRCPACSRLTVEIKV